jgi:hypothetical protein
VPSSGHSTHRPGSSLRRPTTRRRRPSATLTSSPL